MHYDKITKILHWLIASTILMQLLSETFMKRPKPGRIRSEDQELFFEVHEWFGVIVLVLVLLRFVFIMDREEWSKLFPWITAEGRRGIISELKEVPGWLIGKLRDAGEQDYIAKTVHGLGLLLALALGISGTVLFVGMNPDGSMDDVVHFFKETHELLGELLWYYVIGHVAMALLHQLMGHRSLQRIFSFKDQ
ncbi:MAG: cytochrome b/b6 domain-containing protein [Mariprofundaceae bacterium]